MKYKFNVNINMMIDTDDLDCFEKKIHNEISNLYHSEEDVIDYCYNSNYEEIWTKKDAKIYNKALGDVLEILPGMKTEDYLRLSNKIDGLRKEVKDNE